MRIRSRVTRWLIALGIPGLALGAAIASTTPALATGPFNIWLENGNQAMSSSCVNSGCLVIDSNHPGRNLTWVPLSGNYRGDPIGYWEWYNTNMVAAQDSCVGLTTKSTSGSNGIVWAQHISGGHLYYVNRYCDENISGIYAIMASPNSNGHQWKICFMGTSPDDCAGLYQKLIVNPA